MKRYFLILAFVLMGCATPPLTPPQTEGVFGEGNMDPNVALAIAGAQLTGTAQAWEMQQVSWTVTAQSWTMTPSLTPVPTSTPTITFTPTVNVTGTMAVAQAQAELTKIALESDRQRATNTAKAWLPYFVALLALGLAVFLGYVGAMRLSMMPTPVHAETGRAVPMVNVLDGVAWDGDRLANGMAIAKQEYVKVLPEITGMRQDMVNQMVLAKLPKRLPEPTATAMLEAPKQIAAGNDAGGLFPLPSWEIARGWDGKGGLPFGVHAGGMGLVDLEKTPHTAVFGETGSGKSRRFLRPLITFALAAGMRVVILGKQVDFLPFANHQNAYILPVRELTLESEAMKYAIFLKAMVDEMGKRDQYLSSVGRSTWAQAGREMTLFVFDEYTNAMDLMPRQYAETTRRYTRGILREGRKYGFSMMLSAQRAVGLRDEVTQLGRAVFHVSDPQESRFALGMPGAEDLQEGYFMAKFGALNMTGAFEPTDAEIASFLADRRAPALEPLPWLDGKFIEPMPEMAALPEKSDLEKLADSIRAEWRPDMSKRAVARLIGKDYAGAWANKIDAMIAYLMSNKNLEGDLV